MLYQKICVALDSSYPVFIGQGIYCDKEILLPLIKGRQVLLVTQEKIAFHHLQQLEITLENFQCDIVIIPDGEENKTLLTWRIILEKLIQNKHERSTTLIALGGGMVGDVTGFAASCYLRGVSFIQIPTTLIAQVDAAIGGKTAVNHESGKNLIGTFHQPAAVISDIDLLQTLPQREYQSGLAEVIKYGLIADADFFAWIELNIEELLARDSAALLKAVSVSSAIKAGIVAGDEKETGRRAILNFGHTFGHALETYNGYRNILHGEAVAVGMMLAASLSGCFDRVAGVLGRIVPRDGDYAVPSADEWVRLMYQDKKVRDGGINLILLRGLGEAFLTDAVSELEIRSVVVPNPVSL